MTTVDGSKLVTDDMSGESCQPHVLQVLALLSVE